jgi:hypothetical protein
MRLLFPYASGAPGHIPLRQFKRIDIAYWSHSHLIEMDVKERNLLIRQRRKDLHLL